MIGFLPECLVVQTGRVRVSSLVEFCGSNTILRFKMSTIQTLTQSSDPLAMPVRTAAEWVAFGPGPKPVRAAQSIRLPDQDHPAEAAFRSEPKSQIATDPIVVVVANRLPSGEIAILAPEKRAPTS
jgi:hypothetical protein